MVNEQLGTVLFCSNILCKCRSLTMDKILIKIRPFSIVHIKRKDVVIRMEKEEKEFQETEKKENNKKADEIIELKKQIESQKVQIDETEDRLKRVAAEFDNYKKRNTKERDGLYNSLIADIVSNFLPILDNLEKAVERSEERRVGKTERN